MKVVILVYSLTGNTLYIAKSVSSVLQEGGHSVSIAPTLAAARELLVSKRAPSRPRNALTALREAVTSADAIGVATLTWALRPPPGLVELLGDVGRGGTMARKPAFVFATAGNTVGLALSDMADALSECGARVISSWSTNKAPDTYYPFTPQAPAEPFRWGEDRINEYLPWARSLRGLLDQWSSSPDSVPEERPAVAPAVSLLKPLVPKSFGNHSINIDWIAEDCVRCGACERNCSTGAIVFDKETGRVVWDRDACLECTSCVANCPKQALRVRGYEDRVFHVFREGTSTKTGDNNWTKLEMNMRLWGPVLKKLGLVTAAVCAGALFLVARRSL